MVRGVLVNARLKMVELVYKIMKRIMKDKLTGENMI